jgi:hypothetical protein
MFRSQSKWNGELLQALNYLCNYLCKKGLNKLAKKLSNLGSPSPS